MLDKKIKIAFGKGELEEIDFMGNKIFVKRFLSIDEQEILRSLYMNEYFAGDAPHVINAEYTLLMGVIEMCTNIKLAEGTREEDNLSALIHVDDMLANYSLVKKIRSAIDNYGEFRALLKLSVEERKESHRIEYSLGKQISNVSDKVMEALELISSFDASDENISRVQKLLENVETSPIMQEVAKAFSDKSKDGDK
jgi:hypothetical protein